MVERSRWGLVTAAVVVMSAVEASDQGLWAQRVDPFGALVAEALRSNPTYAQEAALELRAAADVRSARGYWLPQLALDSRYSEQNGTLNLGDVVNPVYSALNELTGSERFPTDLDLTLPRRHETRVRLTQTVFNEALRHNLAMAKHRQAGQRAQRQASARRLAAEVQSAWLQWAAARSAAEIYGAAELLVRENERVVTRLVTSGNATPEAMYRARAERSDVEQQRLEAEERERAAAQTVNRVVGRALDTAIEEIADSLLCFELPLSEDSAVAHALARREELWQVRESVGAARSAIKMAGSTMLPSVSLAVDAGYQGRNVRFRSSDDFVVASVVVSWNVFDGGRSLASRQAARAEALRAEAMRREVEDGIRLDVRTAYQAAVVARAAMGTAEDRQAAAARTFELVRRRYEEGLATHIEFVDARTALTSAELNRALSLYRYALRWVDLERAAGLREVESVN
jgi:outer membrane protein TolC